MLHFPHPFLATDEGLLAIGGDLSPERLILAYQHGIFPWYEEPPILWWFLSPRCVMLPGDLHISKSTRKSLEKHSFHLTTNRAFEKVMESCALAERKNQESTWIQSDMIDAYSQLHQMGFAHSVEVWKKDELVGGLYGVGLGRIFCGESMFSKESNASKLALIYLCRKLFSHGIWMIDCQQDTPHMRSMGARLISRDEFWRVLKLNRKENATYIAGIMNETEAL
jgi:leucyl/phenylalanyl-tRNA--protein transferase